MKSFFRGLLTIWIIILLVILGIVLSLKNMLVNTADEIIKKEVTNTIVDEIENYTNKRIPEEVINEVEDTIENNKEIKEIVNTYFDEMIDILSNKEDNTEIDVAEELNNLIDDGEKILNKNNITIPEEEKQKLLSIASSEEVNDLINSTITEAKQSMNSEILIALDIYNFLTDPSTKLIIIALIIISLLFIALLKKSAYLWLSNFAVASILSGIFVGILVPILIDSILKAIASEVKFSISTNSLTTYGYTLIILGVISIIIKALISMILKRNARN